MTIYKFIVKKGFELLYIATLLNKQKCIDYLFDNKPEMFNTTMIKGLAYNAILSEARFMMDRGYATPEEYRDVYLYLYEPYKTLGGNGAAERVMQELGRLPMKGNSHAHLHSE